MNQFEKIKPLIVDALRKMEGRREKPRVKRQDINILQCVCGYTTEDQKMGLSPHKCPLADTVSILKTNSDCFGGIFFEKFYSFMLRRPTPYSELRYEQLPENVENMRWVFASLIEFVVWVTKPPFFNIAEKYLVREERQANHRPLRNLFHIFITSEYAQVTQTQLKSIIFTPSTYYENNYFLDTWKGVSKIKGAMNAIPPYPVESPTPDEIDPTPDYTKAFEIVTLRQIARLWKGLWDDEWADLVNTNQGLMKTLDMSNPLLTRDLLYNLFLSWTISVPPDKEIPAPLWNIFGKYFDDCKNLHHTYYSQETSLSFLCHTDTLKLRKVKWPIGRVDPPEKFYHRVVQQEHWYCEDCRKENPQLLDNEVYALMKEWRLPIPPIPQTGFTKNIHAKYSEYLEETIQDTAYEMFEVLIEFLRELEKLLGHRPTVEEVRLPYHLSESDFKDWSIHGVQSLDDLIHIACDTDFSFNK